MINPKHKKENHTAHRRLIEIDKLIANNKYPNVPYLKKKFEVSEATILRDIERIREFADSAQCEVIYDRKLKGYAYTKPTFRLPALMRTEQEIAAAAVMKDLLETIHGTPLYEKAITVFTSLSDTLDANSANTTVKKLSGRVLFLGMNPVPINDTVWQKLEEAIGHNRYIKFYYRSIPHAITIQPWQLIFSDGMWTLYGLNPKLGKDEIRFYNIPEIHDLEILDAAFELPEDFAYTKKAKGNFRRYIGKNTYIFKITITSEQTLDYIKTYQWAEDQKFETQTDGSTIMTFTSNQEYPVLGWVLSHGMYAVPLEPKWLVDEWKKNVDKMSNTFKLF